MLNTGRVSALLLPGMDGTGELFKEFLHYLGEIDVRVVSYSRDTYQTYEQLADHVINIAPIRGPYVIIAESYSGPVAALIAAKSPENLRAVVFVASFASLPCGRMGSWIARIVPDMLFRWRAPAWTIRWLLAGSTTTPGLIPELQAAIGKVHPDVLAKRFRAALRAEYTPFLRNSSARIICLLAEADRLIGNAGHHEIMKWRPDVETDSIAGPHLLLQCNPADSFKALQNRGIFGG